jgi:hypothetical protein
MEIDSCKRDAGGGEWNLIFLKRQSVER